MTPAQQIHWERQKRIAGRIRRLRHLMRAGILDAPPTSKTALRSEIEALCFGVPITRVPMGVTGLPE